MTSECSKIIVEYVWIGGEYEIRSKTRVIDNINIEIANNNYKVKKNQKVSLSIKSESIQIKKISKTNSKISNNQIVGKISEITFLGQFVRYLVVLNNKQEIQVRSYEDIANLKVHDKVSLSWKLEDFLLHQN